MLMSLIMIITAMAGCLDTKSKTPAEILEDYDYVEPPATYTVDDHWSNATNGTNDTLMILGISKNMSWDEVVIQIIDDSGNPFTCSLGGSECRITQYGDNDSSWEKSEYALLGESDVVLCSAYGCEFTLIISNTATGNYIQGPDTIVCG